MKGDDRSCGNCGRLMSWLDVCHTAVSAGHSGLMLAKALAGDYGNITSSPINELKCCGCNHVNGGKRQYCCTRGGNTYVC